MYIQIVPSPSVAEQYLNICDTVSSPSPNTIIPATKRTFDGSSGDEERYAVSHTGLASLQLLRATQAASDAAAAADTVAVPDHNAWQDRDAIDPYASAAAGSGS